MKPLTLKTRIVSDVEALAANVAAQVRDPVSWSAIEDWHWERWLERRASFIAWSGRFIRALYDVPLDVTRTAGGLRSQLRRLDPDRLRIVGVMARWFIIAPELHAEERELRSDLRAALLNRPGWMPSLATLLYDPVLRSMAACGFEEALIRARKGGA